MLQHILLYLWCFLLIDDALSAVTFAVIDLPELRYHRLFVFAIFENLFSY